jgi:hypothetical protein
MINDDDELRFKIYNKKIENSFNHHRLPSTHTHDTHTVYTPHQPFLHLYNQYIYTSIQSIPGVSLPPQNPILPMNRIRFGGSGRCPSRHFWKLTDYTRCLIRYTERRKLRSLEREAVPAEFALLVRVSSESTAS